MLHFSVVWLRKRRIPQQQEDAAAVVESALQHAAAAMQRGKMHRYRGSTDVLRRAEQQRKLRRGPP